MNGLPKSVGPEALHDPIPHSCLLSNGRYLVLVSAAGSGYSTIGGCALTRWSADKTEDTEGFFIFVRDLTEGGVWSLGHQPVKRPADNYEAQFHPGKAVVTRLDDGVETRMEIAVAPDEDVEVRRVTVQNHTNRCRRIELTSYLEVVLGDPRADAAHPAFSKLFIQTEYVPDPLVGHATGSAPGNAALLNGTLLARRRMRSPEEPPAWLVHAAHSEGPLQYETDRLRFVGRGRSLAEPLALILTSPLSGTVGNVLDPVLSIRRFLTLEAGQTGQVTFLLGAAPNREAALTLAGRYAEPTAVDGIFERAIEFESGRLAHLDITAAQARYLQALAGIMLYGQTNPGAAPRAIRRGAARPPDLYKYGLQPDRPLVVARPRPDRGSLVRDLLKAHAYWRAQGLNAELLILDDEPAAFAEDVRRTLGSTPKDVGMLGVLALQSADIRPADLDLINALARVVAAGALPSLAPAGTFAPPSSPRFTPASTIARAAVGGKRHSPGAESQEAGPDLAEEETDRCGAPQAQQQAEPEPLRFFNGYGGFTDDGSEYVIRLTPEGVSGLRRPPMPWVNVVANENLGFIASESGAGYTWSRNSREHRLTPWHNDPVADPHGEALYVRDEDGGVFWSPLPGPVPQPVTYEVRHGFGYTSYRHTSQHVEQDVCLFVPRRDPVKITRLNLTNRALKTRRLSIFAYLRLVMGELPFESARFVVTEFDADLRSLLAWNPYSGDFAAGVAFAAVVAPPGTEDIWFTADRAAFIGRNGSPERPAALLHAAPLDGRTGAGLDPCIAFQVTAVLPPGGELEYSFLFGEVESRADVRSLLDQYRIPTAIDAALVEVRRFWRETLSAIRVETPTPATDVMVNGWLSYQNLSCRLWARSAFYQSGGAFGFRDQLQDAAALVYVRPDLTRGQILLHAGHQFVEGDVLHWWHPPAGRGIRTRFSDDLLWLPYATAFYVQTTGDLSILGERPRFITTRQLAEGEDDAYLMPEEAGQSADLYEHCCRALDRSLTRGANGLPLMGTGDWNDGMNRVGREGRGESVWLGFFIYFVLGEFISLCESRADHGRVERYHAYRERLRDALNSAGWDGGWYRRAYYDDGTPLGSAHGDECRIDAVAQAWAVLSKAAPAERGAKAMDAVEEHLVSGEDGLIRLLTPPFDATLKDPGYIKGYVPGVRENGGQYTHAALWVVRALAELGRGDRAQALLAMLSPVSHARTEADAAVYKVEPYVVAADVYSTSPHIGRGGWTWYTGSAGWMYRVALESVLGFTLVAGNTIVVRPCIPETWAEYRIRYQLPDNQARYEIVVRNPKARAGVVVVALCDGRPAAVEDGAARIPILRDGAVHQVEVVLG